MAQLTGKHGKKCRLRFTRNFKRAAASAASRNIRICDLKAGTAQSVQKINRRTREIVCAIDVNQDLDTILFDPLISLLCLVELHPVLHSGAAPCLNEDPEAFIAVLGVFRDKLVQSSKGRICHIDHCVLQLSDTLAKSQRLGVSGGGRFWSLAVFSSSGPRLRCTVQRGPNCAFIG
jgi:hypothetical protein